MSKARQLADLGNAYSDGALSNRNMIINGAMQVAQRGTSVTGTTANGYSTVDRFTNYLGGSSDYATFDVSQSTDAPTGFSKSHKIEVATLGSTAGPVTTAHNIEGNSIGSLGWGSAGANKATISFWVKSNVTGVYALEAKAQNGASLYRNVNNYTVNSSGVWEYKTITIDALTAITPASDSSLGLALEFWLDDSDGAYNGSSSAFETWVDGSTTTNGARAYGQTAQILSAASNYWQITGVQLEVGDTATPFEHRSYGDELQRCQRYYQVGAYNGNAGTDLGDTNPTVSWMPVTAMRASATMSMRDDNAVPNRYIDAQGNSVSWYYGGLSHRADNTSFTGSYTNSIDTGMFVLDIGSASVGASSWIRFFWQADAEL